MPVFQWDEYDGDITPPTQVGYPIDKEIERKNAKGRFLSNIYYTNDGYDINQPKSFGFTQGDSTPWIDLAGVVHVSFMLADIRGNNTEGKGVLRFQLYGTNAMEKPSADFRNNAVNNYALMKQTDLSGPNTRTHLLSMGEGAEIPLVRWVAFYISALTTAPNNLYLQVIARRMQPLKEWDR